jgi:hypothetical protein
MPVEVRSLESRRIGGIAAPYNKPSRPLPTATPFIEVFESRSFAKSIGDGFAGVVANLEHAAHMLLGTVESRTLDIIDTPQGLDYTVHLGNNQASNDALDYVSRGLIRGSSITMHVYADHFEHRGAGLPTRHLEGVRLLAISPVSTPAYNDTTVSMRSFATQFDADLDEVVADAKAGNLSRYFSDTHPTHIDMAPTRSMKGNTVVDKDVSRRQAKLVERQQKMDRDEAAMTTAHARMILRNRQQAMQLENEPQEVRNLWGAAGR